MVAMRFSAFSPLFVTAFVAGGLVVACAPRPAKSGADGDDSSSSSSTTKHKGTPMGEESHAKFVQACAKKPDMDDYCECGWGVYSKMFSAEDAESDDINDARMAKLQVEVTKQCAGKLPEPTLRDAFVTGCKKDDASLDGYCGCMWTELRKTFSAGELAQADVVKTRKFNSALGVGAKTCSVKMPETSVKKAFMTGCAEKPGTRPFCECFWKDLRGRMSLGEIHQLKADDPDMKPVYESIGKKCSSLLPKDSQ
jgi:hypothetical protein